MSTRKERQRRRFSEEIKKEVVKRIDRGEQSISSVRRELEVSFTTIYRWLGKYSVTYRKQERLIVEKKSYQSKVKQLESELEALQAALGRKQLQIDYLEKLIDLAEAEQKIDIRKKAKPQLLSGSDSLDQNIRGQ